MSKQRTSSTIHVGVEITRELDGLVRRLEERADRERHLYPVRSGDLNLAANYLRLIFRLGHPLYRVPWVRRSAASAEAYAAESLVGSSVGGVNE